MSRLVRSVVRKWQLPGRPSMNPVLRNRARFRWYYAHPTLPYVMCAIPKAGTSTLKGWFLASATDLSRIGPNVHRFSDWNQFHLRHARGQRILEMFESRLVFAFVRDPVGRVVSAYVDKYVRAGDPPTMRGAVRFLERATRTTYDREHPGMTFREFVAQIAASSDRALDPHWRPQAWFTDRTPGIEVVKLEQLSENLALLSDAFGVAPARTRHAMPYSDEEEFLGDTPSRALVNRSRKADGSIALPTTAQLIDDETRSLIATRYAADLALRASAGAVIDAEKLAAFARIR